jgi:hypothetical protein
MDEILEWSDLFKLNDKTPIEDAIKTLNSFKAAYVGAIETAVTENKVLSQQYAKMSSEATTWLSTLEKVNTSMSNSREVTMKAAKEVEALATATQNNLSTSTKNKTAIDDMSKAVDTLSKAETELLKTKKFLAGAEKDAEKNRLTEMGSINDLKKQLNEAAVAYAAMGDATDDAIKQEQLKTVAELAEQHKKASDALNEAKKATTNAAGSYNELNKRVIEGKKRLKEMEGGVQGTSKEFKALKKEVKEGTDKLKEWDEGVGDNQRKVGDYAGQLAGLIPGFSGLAGGIDSATKASWAFIATPIGAILAAVAAALALVGAWFTRTESGGDKLAEIIERVSAVMGVLMDALANLGGALFEALSEPGKILEWLGQKFEEVKALMIDMFTSPGKYIKELGVIIYDNIINRFLAIGKLGKAIAKILSGELKEGFKDLANASGQLVTGVEDPVNKVVDLAIEAGKAIANALDPLLDKMAKADELGKQLAALKDSLEDQEVALIKSRAKTELQVNELLLKAKDKLKFSDEQRYQAIKDVSTASEKLLNEELAAAQKKIAIAQKEIEIRKLTLKDADIPLDLLKAQNEAEAELLGLKAKRMQEQKRLQQQEIAIIREIEKEMQDRIKREAEAERALAKVRSDIRVKNLQDVQNDAREELEVRNNALKEIAALQQEQYREDAEKQLEAAQEAALSRIELDSKTLETIYNNTALSISERIQLEREAKLALIDQDHAYVNERMKIEEDLEEKIIDSNQNMIEAVADNVFKQLASDFENMAARIKTGTSELLVKLNEDFAAGNVSLKEYEDQRKKIQEEGQQLLLEDQLDYLEQKAALLKQDGQDTTKIEEEIARTRLAIADAALQEQLEMERQMIDAKRALQEQAYETTISFFEAGFEREDMAIQAHMDKLALQRDADLAAAGDNEEAKAVIQNNYAQKQKELEQEQLKNARKKAIFDKAAAIFQIGVNTAVAISSKLPGLPVTAPLIALVAALGALQIAAVLAKPIPQFAKGTMNSPEGLAIVNELGPEFIQDKDGKVRMINTDGPTLTYLKGGSKVFPADVSEKMLKDADFAQQLSRGYSNDADKIGLMTPDNNDRELIRMMGRKMDSLEHTIKNKREYHFNEKAIADAVAKGIDWEQYKNENYR